MKDTAYGLVSDHLKIETLADLCVSGGIQTGPFGSQLHQKDYLPVGTPIITVEHLGENRVLHQDLPRISDEDKGRLSRYVMHKGDIIFSRVGSVDRRALVRDEEDGWLFSGRCLRVRPDNTKIDSDYLSWFFGLEIFKDYIRRIAVGATMPSLNTELLSNVPVIVPPLPEQRAIAEILGALDDKIELNSRMNRTLESMARTVFREWFVVNVEIKDWLDGSILGFANLLSGGTPSTAEPSYWNGTIDWVSAKDVGNAGGYFLLETEKKISPAGINNSSTKMLPAKTTVVTARGTVGTYCLLGRPMTMNQTNYGLKAKEGIGDYFVYFTLKNIVEQLHQQSYGTIFDTITTRTFREITCKQPPMELVRKFEIEVSPLMEAILNNQEQNRTLASLRDTLLPKLMRGEVRVRTAD